MKPIVFSQIEKYAAANSGAESALLKALAKETYAKTEWPQMQVGHLEGTFLRMFARISAAQRILEMTAFLRSS